MPCEEVEAFEPTKLSDLIDEDVCRVGRDGGLAYILGVIGTETRVPIAILIADDLRYDRSYAHIVGGPGADHLAVMSADPSSDGAIQRVVADQRIAAIWIGYSGVASRTSLERGEFERSVQDVAFSLNALNEQFDDLSVVAGSFGALLYAEASNLAPDTPVYFHFPLLAGKKHFFTYIQSTPLAKEVWDYGYIRRPVYDPSSKEVYGSQKK